jgi:hypothetical protein
LQLLWTILDMNDSAAVAAARSAIDWTFTDEDGGRWGVSQGGIHLGDITIPFPFSFGAAPGSEAARRAWMDAEIDRAAGSAAARENLDERIRAIRERLDRLRQVQPRDTIGSP